MRRWPDLSQPRRPILLFLLQLAVYWGVGLILLGLFPSVEAVNCRSTAVSIALLLRASGVGFTLSGPTLVIGNTAIRIVSDCTPVLPIILLWSAILAFPSTLFRKLLGLVLAAGALWLLNLFRILALIGVLAMKPGLFDLLHVYLWQVITSAAIFGFFILWAHLPRTTTEAAS